MSEVLLVQIASSGSSGSHSSVSNRVDMFSLDEKWIYACKSRTIKVLNREMSVRVLDVKCVEAKKYVDNLFYHKLLDSHDWFSYSIINKTVKTKTKNIIKITRIYAYIFIF